LQTTPGTLALQAPASRRALAGFILSGLLVSFLGTVLPAWGYHLRPHFVTVGNYFLALNAGTLCAVTIARPLLAWAGIGRSLAIACSGACAAMMILALTAPPVAEWWRFPGLILLGCSAGVLHAATFHAISPVYRLNPAATVILGGMLFGLGASLTPLLVAGTFGVYSLGAVLLPVALVPALFALLYASRPFNDVGVLAAERPARSVLREFTVPGAVLLSALLFVQCGNEFAISGWLPLFLIQRVGMNPARALVLVFAYWIAITLGRLAAQAILPLVSQFWLLLGSAVAAWFGCLVLTFTNNQFGAWFGTLLVGFAFAPIYPLVVEKIGTGFPHYHPGFFNGIFSVGLTGGMLAPAALGYLSEFFGIGIVMALPALGTAVVVILVFVIWARAKLTEWMSAKPENDGLA
jgi:fucose permease